MKKIKSLLLFLIVLITFNGCVSSYKDVKPGYITDVKNFEYTKDVRLDHYQDSASYGDITLDAKIAPDKEHFILGKINTDKEIYFRYLSRIETSKMSNVSISERAYYPKDFDKIEKLKIPAYITGINVFDINSKGNFAYISNKNVVKILNKFDLNSLSNLEKNKNYTDKNIKTLSFGKDVKQISFQANSNTLIVVLDNNSIELWDYMLAKRIKILGSHKNNINLIKASFDGKYLVSSDNDKTYLWDLKTYKSDTLLNKKNISALDISTDSNKLAFVDDNGKISIYDLASKKEIQQFPHNHTGNVNGIIFSPKSNNTLITAGEDALIKTWDLNNTKYQIHTKYNKSNKQQKCNANTIVNEYFSIKSNEMKKFESEFNPKITQCNILGNKEQITNYSNHNIFNLYKENLIYTLVNKYPEIKKEWIFVDLLSPFNGSLTFEFAEYLRKKNGGELKEYKQGGHLETITTAKFSYSPEDLENFLNSKEIKNTYEKTLSKYKDEYKNLLLHMNGGAIYGMVSYGDKILPFGSGFQEKYSYYENKSATRTAAGVPQKRFDFSKHTDERVYTIYEKDIFKTGYENYDEIIGIEGSKVVAVKENLIEIWDYKNKKLLSTIAEDGVIYSLAYNESNKVLAVGLSNHKIKLWDIINKKFLGELVGHTGNILSLAFSEKNNLLISGATDETAIVWDMKKNQAINKFTGFSRAATKIKINENETIISIVSLGDMNSDILFYDLKKFNLIKKISPNMGMIKDTSFVNNDKEYLAVSSGSYSQKESGHKKILLNVESFNIINESFYKPPFLFTVGMAVDKENNKFYIAGNDDEILEFKVEDLSSLGSFYNMGYDDRKEASISTVGITKENKLILGNKKGYISIYK